jgi:hypothetical protein
VGVKIIYFIGFLVGLHTSLISFVALTVSEQSESTFPSSSDYTLGTCDILLALNWDRLLNEYL